MKKLIGIVFASMLAIFSIAPANAALIVTISDGSTTVSETDIDGDGLLEMMKSFEGWKVVSYAMQNPYIGTDLIDNLALNAFAVSGREGSLSIMMTVTDLQRSSYVASYGGTLAGTGTMGIFMDGSNAENGLSNELLYGEFGSGAFSKQASGSISDDDMYSMTFVAKINHTSVGQQSGFSFDVKIPEPAQLALMAVGLLMMGFAGYKRRSH
ncbi:MAG: PEP-CTERM sorting domain-containing protein [Gammaproteobacteria bacterium]|nr:PEP-CTERM sorting domain-containing protein [Gammaproteobacteria bacterium]